MYKAYMIGPLLKPFRLVYLLMLSSAVAGILYSLGSSVQGALGYYLYGIAVLFVMTALFAAGGRYAVEINLQNGHFRTYIQVYGFRMGLKTIEPGCLEYVLLSTVAYTDNNTPLNTPDTYYTVYLVYNGVNKQSFLETGNKQAAVKRAKELAQLLKLDWTDNTLK